MTRKKPYEVLKDIRMRTGLNQSEVARRAKYKSASGYNRWEKPEDGKEDRLIPVDVIKTLLPIFVGKGSPPVTHDELLAISDVKSLPSDVRAAGGTMTGDYADTFASAKGLEVRYHVEKGVYVDLAERDKVEKPTSPILASLEFGLDVQFVVTTSVPRRTCLHCVEPAQIGPARRQGKRAVVAVERASTGLSELAFGFIVSAEGDKWKIDTAEGRQVSGKPLGVVIGAYVRE